MVVHILMVIDFIVDQDLFTGQSMMRSAQDHQQLDDCVGKVHLEISVSEEEQEVSWLVHLWPIQGKPLSKRAIWYVEDGDDEDSLSRPVSHWKCKLICNIAIYKP